MCGLIAYIATEKENQKILEQYQDQQSRGSRGFGIITIKKDSFNILRSTEGIKMTIDLMNSSQEKMIMFHHRLPTSTENKISQTHPIKVSHTKLEHDYYVMHNGVIRNSSQLYTEHLEKHKYKYSTKIETASKYYDGFNDSESFAFELALFIENKTEEIGSLGSAAFLCLQVDKKTQQPKTFFYGRNSSNPLEIQRTEHGILIASDIEEKKLNVPENKLYSIDIKNIFNKKQKTIFNEKPLIFKKEPIVTKTINLTKNYTSTYSKNLFTKPADIYTGIDEGFTKREEAFMSMAESINLDFEEKIENLFTTLTYTDVKESDIDKLTNELNKKLKKKRLAAEKNIRPYYDKKEKEEDDAIEKWAKSTTKKDEEAIDYSLEKHYLDLY